MLQPLIEYGMANYHQEKLHGICESILYSCYCEERLEFVPDGCEEYLFFWNKRESRFLHVRKARHTVINEFKVFVHGIRLAPGNELKIEEEELNYLLDELSRIYDTMDRHIYLKVRLFPKIRKKESNTSVEKMAASILNAKGHLTVEELSTELGYTERHLNNMFTETYGYGPKCFCRYSRFQHALYEILRDPFRNNSLFIEHLSYSDQAHFQREFKCFTGVTPRQFIKNYIFHINKLEKKGPFFY